MEAALIALCKQSVTIEPWTGQDVHAKPTFGAAVTYKARVENHVKNVMATNGEERVSNTTIYLVASTVIDPRSKLTLPAGFYPLSPSILAVSHEYDETGTIHHVRIYTT